jgi:hypothetical protein
MEKENSIYRALLERYENVVSEQYFINQDNTITDIDIGILGDTNYIIHVRDDSTIDALKAFCFDCANYDHRAIKIWYTDFVIINEVFKYICKRENVIICYNLSDLIKAIKIPIMLSN